jgi:hypothetical protein
MPSVKLITPKIINELKRVSSHRPTIRFWLLFLLIAFNLNAWSQDNSPYSRYGIGDLVPSTNINSRAMGGISAGYNDFLNINYNNPASYASFQAFKEQNSKKMAYGRALLDVGLNIENRTLKQPNSIGKFTASNFLVSHVQVGVPIRPNWGLSFGLRPISRISYKIAGGERLKDPQTGLPIDSAITLNQGDGGAYLASIGTGWRIHMGDNSSISLGFNYGYLFGKKDYSSRRTFVNDSIAYNSGNFQTRTSYGSLYGNAGLQYLTKVDKDLYLTIGAFGNWKQNINASQDIIRETYTYDEQSGYLRLDSVSDRKNIKGKIVYPTSYTAGLVLEKEMNLTDKKGGWLVGVDFMQGKWSEYRVYGETDPAVRDKWELRVGGQLRPVAKQNYFSNVAYRAGFFIGDDYIAVDKKMPLLGFSLGFGLPVRNYNRLSPGQATLINTAFEFIKRGNNDNLLKENLFRFSIGLSLSDFWFAKKKYE